MPYGSIWHQLKYSSPNCSNNKKTRLSNGASRHSKLWMDICWWEQRLRSRSRRSELAIEWNIAPVKQWRWSRRRNNETIVNVRWYVTLSRHVLVWCTSMDYVGLKGTQEKTVLSFGTIISETACEIWRIQAKYFRSYEWLKKAPSVKICRPKSPQAGIAAQAELSQGENGT